MRDVASVEDVVLEHEEYIESYGEESETELCGVSKQRAPIVIVVGDQKHLEHAQSSSCEVEEDVPDAPTNCTFSSEVHESLWYVLDQGDPQLHVGAVVEEVQPHDDRADGEDEDDDDEHSNCSQDGETDLGDGLIASLETMREILLHSCCSGHSYLVYNTLEDGEATGPDSVDGEEHIVSLDWDDSPRVSRHVFLLERFTV